MAGRVTAMDKKLLVATLPVDANLSEWCRRLGISRPTAYKWRQRYASTGVEGLADLSRAPLTPHGKTDPRLEALVIEIRHRLKADGLDHGPASIWDRLAVEGAQLSEATVWRI